jgi:hypothetical protein
MSQNISLVFECKKCNYVTRKKSDYDKHALTRKHTNTDKYLPKSRHLSQLKYKCNCGKEYTHRQSLYTHKQTCNETSINVIEYYDTPCENIIVSNNNYNHNSEDINHLTSLVIEVVKNNSEFQKQMFDMCKNMQSTIMTNCNNTQNNTFNLQVFLNEYCKDAMNISEFVDSFELNISDLENVGRLGYIEGMSNIIISKIKELDVNKRPIHCSDLKREIIYIKDEDKWEREDSNNSKFRKVIKRVSGKNIDMLNDWKEKYPEHEEYESVYNDIYMKLIIATMGGEDLSADENKIMKRVTKHVVIDKKMIL